MKQKINLIILILLPLSLQSQNLIMNGGFENLERSTLGNDLLGGLCESGGFLQGLT